MLFRSVTKGGDGSSIYTADKIYHIESVAVTDIKDPTGCGDAYRAGLLYGLMNQLDWQTTGQIASLMGAIKVAHAGTQNHHFNLDEFKERYEKIYKSTF